MNRLHRVLAGSAMAGGLVLAGLSAPLLAQSGEKNAPKAEQPTEATDGAAARAKLNADQAAAAKAQVANNVNSEAEYQRKLQENAAATAKIASDAAAAQAAYEAEKTRRETEYQAQREKWQADVDACNAGHKERCIKPATAE